MATIVWGHGTRDRGEEKTFVPEGLTVKWYADLDETLLTSNGFLAVDTGNFGTPTDQMGPGDATKVEIYNYGVSSDLAKRDLVSLLNEGGRHDLKFVGADVDTNAHLCNDVAGCQTNGSHKCDGVFGKATVTWTKNPDLVVLVCRGLKGAKSNYTAKFGDDDKSVLSDFDDDITEVIRNLMSRVNTDPEGVERTYDNFPEKSQIYATTNRRVTGWLAVRWAADYGRKGDIPALFKQLENELDNTFAAGFVEVPRYADGLAAAATSKPEEFFGTLDSKNGSVKAKILAIPGVVTARQGLQAKKAQKAQFASENWVPDDDAKKATQLKNQENLPDDGTAPVYAGGVVMLIGGGHNSRVEAYVDRQADREKGSLVATKGGAFKVIKVRGITKNKTTVEGLFKEISDKKVKFE